MEVEISFGALAGFSLQYQDASEQFFFSSSCCHPRRVSQGKMKGTTSLRSGAAPGRSDGGRPHTQNRELVQGKQRGESETEEDYNNLTADGLEPPSKRNFELYWQGLVLPSGDGGRTTERSERAPRVFKLQDMITPSVAVM